MRKKAKYLLKNKKRDPIPDHSTFIPIVRRSDFPAKIISNRKPLGNMPRSKISTPIAQDEKSLRVKSSQTHILKYPIVVDPSFNTPLILSFIGHIFFISLLFMTHSSSRGNAMKSNTSPVEMVFTPPQSNHETPPKVTANVAHSSSPPTQEKESSQLSDITSADGEIAATKKEKKKIEKPKKNPPSYHPKYRSNTPLSYSKNWSLNAPYQPQSQQENHKKNSHGPINMSLGPLSTNGQINAPYKTSSYVKGVSSDYGSEIDQWIRDHMYYPQDAADNGEEGPTSVHVVIDRNGFVRSAKLTSRSGSYALDAATVSLFENVQLPPVPPDMSGDHFDLDVTIDYKLIRHSDDF